MGKLWYISHLLGYILRLPPNVAARLTSSQAAIGFYPSSQPLIGLHIRHGDKASEGGAQVGIEHYVGRAKELAQGLIEQSKCIAWIMCHVRVWWVMLRRYEECVPPPLFFHNVNPSFHM